MIYISTCNWKRKYEEAIKSTEKPRIDYFKVAVEAYKDETIKSLEKEIKRLEDMYFPEHDAHVEARRELARLRAENDALRSM